MTIYWADNIESVTLPWWSGKVGYWDYDIPSYGSYYYWSPGTTYAENENTVCGGVPDTAAKTPFDCICSISILLNSFIKSNAVALIAIIWFLLIYAFFSEQFKKKIKSMNDTTIVKCFIKFFSFFTNLMSVLI